ncbi:SDR family NAD(P)-dependent oxidoreductase [Paenibacillus eucommiae]|uniref:NAD(P)-dependent dehydrogenase (Short-subunit alcohol dehydrogenase family) n=1 Tax=Paenibacillus eucommiae TaxID=1355755 RepID=A0ABS4IM88_9BACL|nr:SDR family oxidoreductase [Paenibacillus eucommiae]MBP1988682.1 NAD(P)-dependent dehydrogenase (short-subunit alcohol dehydrogenase family) [Paenibacillus eucommiae]
MLRQLDRKVILVTGAFGQAGQSAVGMFLEKGAFVLATDYLDMNQSPKMMELQEQYGGERLQYIKADIFEENQVQAVMAEVERHFGRLDGTYHTVYGCVEKSALELSIEEWESTLKGTLTSTFLVCKYALPIMIRSGGGSLVNMSSVLAFHPNPTSLAYGTAKAGINQFTRILAATYAKQGIRANVIVPGDFKTEENWDIMSEKTKEIIRSITLLGRSGKPSEINEMAAFLLSDAASYVTGALFTIDGGYKI